MKGLSRLAAACLLSASAFASQLAFAVTDYEVDSDTTIGVDDHAHDGQRLIVSGATLTIAGAHAYESVLLENAAILTTPEQQAISITADSFQIDATSRIDVSVKGKPGDESISLNAGGSYGGVGGVLPLVGQVSKPGYGDFRHPLELGTGGRGDEGVFSNGGGAVNLQVGQLKLDGQILANGETFEDEQGNGGNGIDDAAGGGSGGSIQLTVEGLVLGPDARLEAQGGRSAQNDETYPDSRGGGGGGRIAVHFKTLSGDIENQASATGGRSTFNANRFQPASFGSAGTIFLEDQTSATSKLVVSGRHHDLDDSGFTQVDIGSPPSTTALIVTNTNVNLVGQTFGLITVNNAHVNQTSDAHVSNLLLNGGGTWDQAGFALQADAHTFSGGTLVRSGPFNQTEYDAEWQHDLTVDGYTLALTGNTKWGVIRIINGGVITAEESAADATQGITITADTLSIDASSRLDVSGKGHPGVVVDWQSGAQLIGAGSYGGIGSHQDPDIVVPTYGDFRAPQDLGTGGGGGQKIVTRGGGAVTLKLRVLDVSGNILANGQAIAHSIDETYQDQDMGWRSGVNSGSGGSINITTDRLSLGPFAYIGADGGTNINSDLVGGGGGGGRVALAYNNIDSGSLTGTVHAYGGFGAGLLNAGSAGTVYLKNLRTADEQLLVDNTDRDGQTAASTPLELSGSSAFQGKLLVKNANVELHNAELAALDVTGGSIVQAGDVYVSNLSMTGGVWDQAGHDLNVDEYHFSANTLNMNGSFSAASPSLDVDGYTLVLPKSGKWQSVNITNGGVLTTVLPADDMVPEVEVSADSIFVDATSRIDVSSKGLLQSSDTTPGCGGSHGGLGGSRRGCSLGPVYGDANHPITYGKGGGHEYYEAPSSGGGAIKLAARLVKIEGQVLANGDSPASFIGAGAGGSILINSQLLQGGTSTHINAMGGSGSLAGSGGGGRVAIYYSSLQGIDPLTQVSVAAGADAETTSKGAVGSLVMVNQGTPVAVAAADVSGLVQQSSNSFTLTFTIPIDVASLNSSTVQLTGPNGQVGFSAITPIESVNPLTFRIDVGAPLASGSYELQVRPGVHSTGGVGMDQNNNGVIDEPEDVFVRPFVVNQPAPAAPHVNTWVVAPGNNAVKGYSVDLSGTRDKQTSVLVNGSEVVPLGDGPWSATITLFSPTSTVRVQSANLQGVTSDAVSVQFQVDNHTPQVYDIEPSGYTAQTPTGVFALIDDAGYASSGINPARSSLILKHAGSVVPGSSVFSAATQDNPTTRIDFAPQQSLAEGTYTVYVETEDNAGNHVANSATFTIDLTAPQAPVVATYPAVTSNATVKVSGTKEAGASISYTDAAGTQHFGDSTDSTSWSMDVELQPGVNHFIFTQADAAHNQSPATAIDIRFDDNAPGLVNLVIDGKGKGTELTLGWPSYDEAANGGDIKEYRVYSSATAFTSTAQAQLIATLPAGSKQFTVTGLVRGEQRFYAVIAVDQQGLMVTSAHSVAGTPTDTIAPEDPTALTVLSSANQLDITWQGSPNSVGDLKGYALYVGNATQPITLMATDSHYSIASLASATAYPLRLAAVDNDGNESAGMRATGVTWLGNPTGLTLTASPNRVDASWVGVSPANLVSAYRIYVATAPFSSVQGLTPALAVSGAAVNASVSGLTNEQTYYVAVTTVNTSAGENPMVQSFAVKPTADAVGPELTQILWTTSQGSQELRSNGTLTQLGELHLQATDKSGVARAELTLNDQPLGQMVLNGGEYRLPWDLNAITDGSYTLGIKLVDTLENATQLTVPLRVALAAPTQPTLSLQTSAGTTNNAQQVVLVQGQGNAIVEVQLNGDVVAASLTLSSTGQGQTSVVLKEGANSLQARSRLASRSTWSSLGAELKVTLDTQQPNPPTGLQAAGKPQGLVQLNWATVSAVHGYNVYVSSQPFSTLTEGGVSKANSTPLTSGSYQHKPAVDGTYYYRVTSVSVAGTESAPSNLQSAVADRVLPRVEEAKYSSLGQIASDGRYAPAHIDVSLRMSEELRNAPFFSLDVPQGSSIPVRMAQSANDPTVYEGSFDLTTAVPSGLLYARLSAFDPVGNEGTEVKVGDTLRVDTQGPDVQQLTLLPDNPVENILTGNQGRDLVVTIRLGDDPVGTPQLTPSINDQTLAAVALARDPASAAGAPIYSGNFRLPATAGKDAVDLLDFAYQAQDDLGNTSQRILGRHDFQVYQGTLPPVDIPQDLAARSLAGGHVALTWKAVTDASGYQLYRRASSETQFTAIKRVTDTGYDDAVTTAGLPDGSYFYQVSSVRSHDDKEALSQPSTAIKIDVDSKAPSAPRELHAELNGAGVVLRWVAPAEGGTLTYNLYRSNAAQGQPVSITGLTALQTAIPALLALDSKPSTTEHSYTLTAVDPAGNESAPAEPVYLNSGLLPVSDLRINLPVNSVPALSWASGGSSVTGYNLYLGAESARAKVNTVPLVQTAYQDVGAALPITTERLYSVTAVDAQSVESVPHTLLLPALNVALRADQTLQRGLFNQLYFRVSNNGTQDLKGLKLQVLVNVDGQPKLQESAAFDVAAGNLSEVPVVVAGYPTLPGVVPLGITLVYAPQAGETVTEQQNLSIDATDGALIAQLQGTDFTRGGTGSVRLRLENPSPVVTELVTAKTNGTVASDEMRLVLEDLQGNVLASEPIKAALGTGLVTVRDGRTVLRVPAQDVVQAGPFTMKIPATAPDQVRVRLIADYLHYQTGMDNEEVIKGLRSSLDVTLTDLPYSGKLTAVTPAQVQAGDKVVITGQAIKKDTQQPLANVELKVVLSVRGFEEAISVTTDANGQFTYERQTDPTDSGEYQVSVIHPSLSTRPQDGSFTIAGATSSPSTIDGSFPRNYEQVANIAVQAGYDTPLNNLHLEYVQPSDSTGLPAGIKVQLSPSINLAARASGNLTLRISGDNSAAANGLLDYRVVADGLSRPIGQTRIQYNLVEARPIVKVTPSQLSTGLSRDNEQQESFTLTNSGLDVLRNARLTLLNEQGAPAPDWVSLRTTDKLGDIPAGGSSLINLAFKATDKVTDGDYFFTLHIESDNSPAVDIPIQAAVTQSGKGAVIFQIEDIYTGTLDDANQRILGLKGAKITLQNQNVLSSEFTASSDDHGQALMQDIPAGQYNYRVSAFDHNDVGGQLWIKPGMTQDQRVFLMSKLVTVEWSVKEIPLQDKYEVVLDATFKTNVPSAVVLMEPLSVNLPAMRKGDVFQGELTITNYGLVRADNVVASLPASDARVRFEYLRQVPSTLEASDVAIIPYRVTALQSFDPDDEINGAAGCWSFNYPASVNYTSQCANGMVVPGSANMSFTNNGGGSSTSCGVTSGGGLGGGWFGDTGDMGGGGYSSSTPLGTNKQCPPPTPCVTCEAKGFPANGFGGQ